jgi:hypothetical protein
MEGKDKSIGENSMGPCLDANRVPMSTSLARYLIQGQIAWAGECDYAVALQGMVGQAYPISWHTLFRGSIMKPFVENLKPTVKHKPNFVGL